MTCPAVWEKTNESCDRDRGHTGHHYSQPKGGMTRAWRKERTTVLPTINAETALNLMKAEVDIEGPDYLYEKIAVKGSQYPSCWNVYQGKGSCLIGRALIRHGVSAEVLEEHANESVTELVSAVGMTPLAVEVFAEAQLQQDAGYRWGRALESAEKTYLNNEHIADDHPVTYDECE